MMHQMGVKSLLENPRKAMGPHSSAKLKSHLRVACKQRMLKYVRENNPLKFNRLPVDLLTWAYVASTRKPHVFRQIQHCEGKNTRFHARAIAATYVTKSPSPIIANSQLASSIDALC
jgi:hypothetical protein